MTDGAEWLQGLIDDHSPTALRILDFAHAAEYVSAMGQAATEAGSTLTPQWLEQMLHELKHEGPEQVLAQLRALQMQHPTVALLGEKLAYLEKRERHMQYPTYQQAGWPIGSGIVESANKLVVEARLKGAGRHWERGMSIPCWPYATRCAISAGRRPGKPCRPSNTWGAFGVASSRASNASWRLAANCSSRCNGSTPGDGDTLAIRGGSPFCDALLLVRTVLQKISAHPNRQSSLQLFYEPLGQLKRVVLPAIMRVDLEHVGDP